MNPARPFCHAGGATLRKLPCEIECGRNQYSTGEVDKPVFPLHVDDEQTILAPQPACIRLLRAYRNREKSGCEESGLESDASHWTSL
jgi:hypothetical protein